MPRASLHRRRQNIRFCRGAAHPLRLLRRWRDGFRASGERGDQGRTDRPRAPGLGMPPGPPIEGMSPICCEFLRRRVLARPLDAILAALLTLLVLLLVDRSPQ